MHDFFFCFHPSAVFLFVSVLAILSGFYSVLFLVSLASGAASLVHWEDLCLASFGIEVQHVFVLATLDGLVVGCYFFVLVSTGVKLV